MDRATAPFGRLLCQARKSRGCSQLTLALRAEVSARHLSWLETGKSQPSRAMVLRLAEQLDIPLRERNQWLQAAGYAALYSEHALGSAQMAGARAALQRLLDAHEPWPALAVDRHWNLVAHNRMVMLLIARVAPALQQPPVNVLRLSLHPEGLAPLVANLAGWRAHVLARLQRQCSATGDPVLLALLEELRALPVAGGTAADSAAGHAEPPNGFDDVAVPLQLLSPLDPSAAPLNFITTLTVFGAPHDLTLAELAIETLLPADEATAEALRQAHATLL